MFRGPELFAAVLHSIGLPASQLLAWATIVFEIVGGVAFLLGAFVSLVSIPAIVVLLVAITTVHLPYGFSSIKLVSITAGKAQFGPPGFECALLYIVCIGTLYLTGPGAWSVDALLRAKPVLHALDHHAPILSGTSGGIDVKCGSAVGTDKCCCINDMEEN